MNAFSKTIIATFADQAMAHSLTRRGLVWNRLSAETLVSFGFQKSRYAQRYSLNFGIMFLSLEHAGLEDSGPRAPHKCHYYGRIGDENMMSCFDFEVEPSDGREAGLARLRDEVVIPAVERCSTQTGAVSYIRSGVVRVPIALPSVRPFLSL